MVVAKIKEEAMMWSLAGAKVLCNVIPREWTLYISLVVAPAMTWAL